MTYKLDIDLSTFYGDWQRTVDSIVHDASIAAVDAAEDGVRAEQADHPYTDQTYNLSASAHVEPSSEDHASGEGSGADMVWPAEYASFVNEKRGFRFTGIAVKAASDSLVRRLKNIPDR